MSGFMVFCVIIIGFILLIYYSRDKQRTRHQSYRQAVKTPEPDRQQHGYHFKPKPDWAKNEVIQLKAMMHHKGCRKIAFEFNRQFKISKNITVGKTYVANIIRDHQYQIQVLRNNIKHKPPRQVPRQLIWGVDLTFKTDTHNKTHPILGIIEHQSRKNLSLQALKDKSSISLLRALLHIIEHYGKPVIIRTDNEGVFTSKLFSLAVWLLGIKHQTTELHSPWQNGRVERFFGTLKQKINRWSVTSFEQCNHDL